jgi:hypothetical protein
MIDSLFTPLPSSVVPLMFVAVVIVAVLQTLNILRK